MNWMTSIGAGLVLGLGLIFWLTRRLNQAEADKIEATSQKNWNLATQEAKEMETSAKKAVADVKPNPDPYDF